MKARNIYSNNLLHLFHLWFISKTKITFLKIHFTSNKFIISVRYPCKFATLSTLIIIISHFSNPVIGYIPSSQLDFNVISHSDKPGSERNSQWIMWHMPNRERLNHSGLARGLRCERSEVQTRALLNRTSEGDYFAQPASSSSRCALCCLSTWSAFAVAYLF